MPSDAEEAQSVAEFSAGYLAKVLDWKPSSFRAADLHTATRCMQFIVDIDAAPDRHDLMSIGDRNSLDEAGRNLSRICTRLRGMNDAEIAGWFELNPDAAATWPRFAYRSARAAGQQPTSMQKDLSSWRAGLAVKLRKLSADARAGVVTNHFRKDAESISSDVVELQTAHYTFTTDSAGVTIRDAIDPLHHSILHNLQVASTLLRSIYLGNDPLPAGFVEQMSSAADAIAPNLDIPPDERQATKMNLSDLAARLRQTAEGLHRDGKYDPTTESVLDLPPNGVVKCGGRNLAFQVGPVLRDARRRGAFDLPRVSPIATLIDGASFDPQMLEAVFRHLDARGFNCWGTEPNRGAVERLADAFEALGRGEIAGRPATKTPENPSPKRDTISAGIADYNRCRSLKDAGDMAAAHLAEEEFQTKWVRHADEKIAMYFRVFSDTQLHELRELSGLNGGKQVARTKHFSDEMREATRLGIAGLPEWPEEPFADAQKADAAFSKLLAAVRASVDGNYLTEQAKQIAEPSNPTAALANIVRQKHDELVRGWVHGLAKEQSEALRRISATDEGKALIAEKNNLDAEHAREIAPIEARWATLRGEELQDAKIVVRDFERRTSDWEERCKALFEKDERATQGKDRPFDANRTHEVAPDADTTAAIRRVITDWDEKNWAAVREALITSNRSWDLIATYNLHDIRQAFIAIANSKTVRVGGAYGTAVDSQTRFQPNGPGVRPDPAAATHSTDFTTVTWYGTEYTFALGVQSAAVKALWEEWQKTGLGLHQSTICKAVDAERDSFRMDKAFRGNRALGTMIRSVGDGKYRLMKPTEPPPKPTTKKKKSARIPAKARQMPR
jgi:hypothetical protein